MEERTMYVIQRADGKFYWKHQHFSSYYGYDSFDKAYLFSTEKSAESRAQIGYGSERQECKVKRVKLTLID